MIWRKSRFIMMDKIEKENINVYNNMDMIDDIEKEKEILIIIII